MWYAHGLRGWSVDIPGRRIRKPALDPIYRGAGQGVFIGTKHWKYVLACTFKGSGFVIPKNLGTRQLPVRDIDNCRGWFHSNCKACMRSHVRFDSKQPASCAREPPFLATNCCLPVWKYTQSRGSKLRSIMCAAVTGLADPPRSPSGLRAVTFDIQFSFRVPSSSHRLDQHKRRLRDVWFWFWAVYRLGRMWLLLVFRILANVTSWWGVQKNFQRWAGGRKFDKRRMAYMRLTPLFKCDTSELNGGHLTTHMWRLRTAPKWDVTGFICFPDYR